MCDRDSPPVFPMPGVRCMMAMERSTRSTHSASVSPGVIGLARFGFMSTVVPSANFRARAPDFVDTWVIPG